MFVQVTPPGVGYGPIKIEGVKGVQLAPRLRAIAADNAFDALLIGLVATPTPDELTQTIHDQHEAARLHHDWFTPTTELVGFIQHAAQPALRDLLGRTRPGGLPDNAVDIGEMAAILGVSVPTVRRMVKADEIPYLRLGKALRFMPADVVASVRLRRG